ncbi:MAG: response regulator, partial [Draconibacterium sp.]|nr:response regulator [Draconibacterium sp.]
MLNFKITTVVVAKNLVELEKLVSKLKPFEELSIVGTATTGNQGMSLITNFAPELVFVNVDLQDVNGLEFVRILQSRNIFPKIIFIAGDSQLAYESMT